MLKKILILLIVAIGAFIRITLLLQNRSLWWDETAYFQISQYSFKDIITGNYYAFNTQPWLIFMILKIITSFSYSEVYLRLPSVMAGTILIYVLFLIVKVLTGKIKIALLASFLISISAYHIFQSIHAKGNEITLLFQSVSILYFFYFIKYKKLKFIIIHYIFLFLSLIVSYYTIWYLCLLFFTFLYYIKTKCFSIKEIKLFLIGYLVVFLVFSPWLFLLLSRINESIKAINWVPIPTFSTLIEFLNLYFGFKPIFIYGFMIIILFLFLFTFSKRISNFLKYLFMIWFLFPIISAYILSNIFKPIFIDHYILFSTIAIYIIMAIVSLKYKLSFLLIGIFVFINLFNNSRELKNPTGEDWRGAVREIFLNQIITDKDFVITDDFPAFNYYINFQLKPSIKPNMIYLQWSDQFNKDRIINDIYSLLDTKRRVCIAVTYLNTNDLKLLLVHSNKITNNYPQVICLKYE